MRIGIYPGSFDPLTNGHLDIIKRAVNIFDKVIVAVAKNSAKKPFFSFEERIEIVNKCCKDDNIEVVTFEGLLADYCLEKGVTSIIRGLRSITDFEYEYPIASINRKLGKGLETVFLVSSEENLTTSSNIVREIAKYNGDISSLVPPIVIEKVQKKFS